MTPLEHLAAWLADLKPASIPLPQHQLARLRVVDSLGLIAAAADHPAGKSLAAWADLNRGAGASVLVTGRQASPSSAALVHGSLAHVRDFDDTFAETVVHPGSTIIPAALALAEECDASFDMLTTAIVAGYEVAARLGAPAGRGFHTRGFHATGLVGPIAAAAAAGLVRRLDADRLADAMGLATSMSSGLLAFLGDGGWSKWMHTGWSAHGGVVAAQLASTNFRGPRQGLDHRFGFYGAFLDDSNVNLTPLVEGLGETWRGSEAKPKLYPCAHVIHPYIDAVLAFRTQELNATADIASICCILAPWAISIVAEPRETKLRPRNDLDAIASLPFMLAAALIDGRVDLATLAPTSLARVQVHELATRIFCRSDESLGADFDGRIEFVTHGGQQTHRSVLLVEPSEDHVVAKFRANTAQLRGDACAALLTLVLEQAPTGRALMRAALAAFAPSAPP